MGKDAEARHRGGVSGHASVTGQIHSLSNGGLEEDRQTLIKRLLPALPGVSCPEQDPCPVASGLRFPLETVRRVLSSIDRASYQWNREREYDHRPAVEPVNSRPDVLFGFERHTILGLKNACAGGTRPDCHGCDGFRTYAPRCWPGRQGSFRRTRPSYTLATQGFYGGMAPVHSIRESVIHYVTDTVPNVLALYHFGNRVQGFAHDKSDWGVRNSGRGIL